MLSFQVEHQNYRIQNDGFKPGDILISSDTGAFKHYKKRDIISIEELCTKYDKRSLIILIKIHNKNIHRIQTDYELEYLTLLKEGKSIEEGLNVFKEDNHIYSYDSFSCKDVIGIADDKYEPIWFILKSLSNLTIKKTRFSILK